MLGVRDPQKGGAKKESYLPIHGWRWTVWDTGLLVRDEGDLQLCRRPSAGWEHLEGFIGVEPILILISVSVRVSTGSLLVPER